MDFVALRCLGRPVIAQRLNAGVIKEDVELALSRGESLDGCLDRGQVTKVQMLEDQRTLGLWPSLFNIRDSPIGLVLRTGSDVDLRVFREQNLSYFLTNARVGASDNIDLKRNEVSQSVSQ